MNLKLVKLDETYKELLTNMLNEWKNYKSNNPDDLTPYAIFKNNCNDFSYYLENLEVKEGNTKLVPDSTFFALDTDKNIFVGACNIRHYLNEYLTQYGGHIGVGVRPSERGKGYGKEIVRLALIESKKLGINKVLMTCNKNNIASRNTILSNNGILENEVQKDNEIIQRFWINL